MQGHLPPAAQEKYQEMQELQTQAEGVVAEKKKAKQRLEDAQRALDALEEVEPETSLYRELGSLRVASDRDQCESSLQDTVERMEAKIESLQAREDRLREQFENRKEDIKHLLGSPTDNVSSPNS